MKRLILMGGRPWVAGDKGNSFTKALFRYHSKEIKLAFCIFAQPESEWEETRRWNIKMFDSFRANRNITYQTMTEKNFKKVSEWADMIYIPGGDPYQLLKSLKSFDIQKLWNNKILAGSSAGADLFCDKFVYLQDKSFGTGLGWVNALCIPHWRDNFKDYTSEDWDWAEAESVSRYPKLPVLCIPEGHFVEFAVK